MRDTGDGGSIPPPPWYTTYKYLLATAPTQLDGVAGRARPLNYLYWYSIFHRVPLMSIATQTHLTSLSTPVCRV